MKMVKAQCVNCGSVSVELIDGALWKRPNGEQAELLKCNECDCEWEE